MLTLIDKHTHQCLAIKVARSPKSEDVVQVLVEAIEVYGRPQCIRSDKGSQFAAQKVREALLKQPDRYYLHRPWQPFGRTAMLNPLNHRRRDVPRNVVMP